ncbi:MAG: hypothetical protein R3B70_22585 [Polyangiaceae bacterium]
MRPVVPPSNHRRFNEAGFLCRSFIAVAALSGLLVGLAPAALAQSLPQSPHLAAGLTARMATEPARTAAESTTPRDASVLFEDLLCISGTWIGPPAECACPPPGDDGYTYECESPDCEESEVLMLLPLGEVATTTIRSSAKLRSLSATAPPETGTWVFHDDGELCLALENNTICTPSECEAGFPGELQRKGQAPMTHPEPAMEMALLWAWLTADWQLAPYYP